MQSIHGGLWPAMFTPMGNDRRPNLPECAKLAALFIQQDLDGIFLLGSTGQGPSLSVEDRKAVAEVVLKTAQSLKPRIPVMVHVGAIATDDSVELAKHAADHGADGISSVPPIYYPAGPEATFEHYRRIASATNLPFYPYHAAFMQSAAMSPADYAQRLLAVPNIKGMKITDRDLFVFGQIHEHTKGQLLLFSGADELVCHAALSGASGAIGTFYNIWGPTCRRARAWFVAGNYTAGRSFMQVFQSVIGKLLSSGSVMPFCRAAMRIKYNIELGPGRAPTFTVGRDWDDREVKALLDAVDQSV